MGKDIKILAGVVVITIFVIAGLVFLSTKNSTNPSQSSQSSQSDQTKGISISPDSLDLGDVNIKGGIVSKDYQVNNTTNEDLKLRKIVTSCMCTKAKVVVGDEESYFFGMEHPGDANPPINVKIPAGGSAKIVVEFGPAAHGPQEGRKPDASY